MKPVRLILIVLGIFLGLVALVAGLALTPPIQRWAILRVAAKHPAYNLKLDSVSVGLTSLTLEGVQLDYRKVRISCEKLDAGYSLWAFLIGRNLEIDQLTAKGLLVDGSQLSPRRMQAGLIAAPTVTPGALAQVRLPWALTVGAVDLQGRVLLVGAPGQSALHGDFSLQGGGIAPGREGELRWQARLTDPTAGAPVSQVDVRCTLQLRESTERTFDRLNLSSVFEAVGPGLPGPKQLKLVAAMTRTSAGENYRVAIDTLENGQAENLVALNALLQPDGLSYAGDWAVAMRSAQLESFLMGRTLPVFAANGSGRFSFSPGKRSGAMQGGLQVEGSGFEKIRPELAGIGPVSLKGEVDLTVDGGVVLFQKMQAVLTSDKRPVLELRSTGSSAFNLRNRRLEPAQPAAGEILRLKLGGVPMAWIAPFCPKATISGGLITGEVAVIQGEGEGIRFQTSSPLQAEGISVLRGSRTLLANAALKLEAEASVAPGQAEAKVRSLSLATAAGDSLQTSFTVASPLGAEFSARVAGDFKAELPSLLLTWLPDVGTLRASGSAGLGWKGNRLEVDHLAVESRDGPGNLIGSVAVTHAFAYDLANGLVETDLAGEAALATLKLGQLPLLSSSRLAAGYTVSGRLGPADATVAARGGKMTVRASNPVPIVQVSISQKKKLLVDRIKLQFQPELEFSGGTVAKAQSGNLTMQTYLDVPLAELRLDLDHRDAKLNLACVYSFDLPAWASQPGLADQNALSAGQASGELRAAFAGNAAQIEARTTFNGLIASGSGQTLPVANVSLRADVDDVGHFSVQVPVLLDRAGQRSDLNLAAKGSVTPGGLSFLAKLSSDHLELPDLLQLLAISGSSLAGDGADNLAAHSRGLSPPAADEEAFWNGMTGQLTLDCKSVASGQEWAMTGLTGQAFVEGDRLQLEKLEAAFGGDSRFSAKGGLQFTGGLDPYHLQGDFSLIEFDLGRFFKAVDPEHTPTLEGVFTVKGRGEGDGLNLDDTLDRTRGSFELTSRQGVFRALKRLPDKPSLVTKAVDLVGSIMGDKTVVDQLAQELGELKYDQLSANLVRESTMDLRFDDFILLTQQIHLLGSGRIRHVAGQPFLQQPLESTFSLRVRGKFEELLGKINDLDGSRDQLGYAKTKTPVTIGGTLARPDPKSYFVQFGADKVKEKLHELLESSK